MFSADSRSGSRRETLFESAPDATEPHRRGVAFFDRLPSGWRLSLAVMCLLVPLETVRLACKAWILAENHKEEIHRRIAVDLATMNRQRVASVKAACHFLAERDRYSPDPYRYAEVRDKKGRTVCRSVASLSEPASEAALGLHRFFFDDGEVFERNVKLGDGSTYFVGHGIGRNVVDDDRAIILASLASGLTSLVACCALLFLVDLGRGRRLRIVYERLLHCLGKRAPAQPPREARLEEVTRLLEELRDSLDTLARVPGQMAHEVRRPLARLRCRLADSLVAEEQGGELQLESALKEVDRIQGLLQTVLRMSHLKAGKCEINREYVEAHELLREVVDYYQPYAEAVNCRILLCVEPDCLLCGDRSQLSQAIANLLDNALKYAADSGPIEAGAKIVGEDAFLWVRDRGPGIPSDDRQRARMPFGRLSSAHALPGHGLGLTVVEQIARVHGGQLHLSDANPGLLARLQLPKDAPGCSAPA